MPSLSFYDKQHIQKLLQQQGSVKYIFDEFVRAIGQLLVNYRTNNSDDNVWIRNATIEKNIEKELVKLHDELLRNINQNEIDAWNRSNRKTDDLISEFVKNLAVDEVSKKGMFSHTEKAMRAFMNEKIDGLTVSGRVWKITEGAKDNIEYYLSSGLSVGRPANLISSDVRQLLNNPDRRFHRVRDDNGNLIMSKPMADYHPGQGVYRSSYKNALRMSATQTNMAYHSADHERWKNLDFVTGISVKRSNNAKEPCPICDPLVGDFPKGFKFIGWHPWCICQATPVMLTGDEFTDFLISGDVPDDKIIRNIPQSAERYFADHEESIKKSYVYKNNSEFFKKEGINQKEKKVYDKIIETENKIRMNKDFESGVAYDKDGNVLINKIGKATSVSFTDEEVLKMKDSIFTHNHPRGWVYPENSMQRIGNSFSAEDILSAIKTDLSEIRAVTPNYTFVMKRPVEGWGVSVQEAEKIIRSLHEKELDELQSRIMKGTTTPAKANTVHYHQLWKKVSKKYGWEYSKKKTR